MKKILAVILALALLLGAVSGCGQKDTAKTSLNAIAISGPTGIGMVNLMKANKNGEAANTYNFTVVSSPDGIVAKLANGECDIAAIPTNLASTMYAKTNGAVQVLAVNTLGVLYILTNGETVSSVADLKGKEIYSTGQGSNPEYILNYVLKQNGLDPAKDVTMKYLTENEELAAAVIGGTAKVALVPQPVATTIMTKNTAVKAALDMTEEWGKIASDSRLMMGCVVVRKAFAEENKKAVDKFMKEYEKSIKQATDDVKTTATLCEEFGIIPKAAVAEKAIPECNLTYMDGKDMQKQLSGYLNVLYTANPAAIGGKLPDDAFYYSK